MTKPDCSTWKIWRGQEIEGDSDLGEITLFIRQFPFNGVPNGKGVDYTLPPEFVKKITSNGTLKRVWFCKEMTNYPLMLEIAKHFEKVCIEVTPKTVCNLPAVMLQKWRIYLKLNLPLKEGDFVCVGQAFADEAFRVGTGRRVAPEQYSNDIKIL